MRTFIVITSLLFLASCVPQSTPQSQAPQQAAQLVVQAEGTVSVAADQIGLTLGVVTQHSDADRALADNNQRISEILRLLEKNGLQRDELATGQFRISPQWSVPPRPTPANWQRQIVAYRVDNELRIESDKIALAGKLLGLAQQAGANQVGNLQFTLADPESYRQQAISSATHNAMIKAKTLADAAGAKLGPIISLTLNPTAVRTVQPQRMLAEVRTVNAQNVPLVADQVELSETVQIIYQLKQ